MKKLHFLSIQPDDPMFYSEIMVQLHNFRKYGYSHLARVCIFLPYDKLKLGFNKKWKEAERIFPETSFFYYEDTGNLLALCHQSNYIPLLRPMVLYEHFTEFPELKNDAIFYHDADILFTRKLDFTPFLQDDICYLTNTNSYINSDYFDSKVKDVDPLKLEEYKKIDVLAQASSIVGITREVCEKHKNNSGGAQYLLKNIDADFWGDVATQCPLIRTYLMAINQQYFKGNTSQEKENNGFQSWCADMYTVLWNLWKRDYSTICPPELDHCWATDKIEKWGNHNIFHNAGNCTIPIKEYDKDGNFIKAHLLYSKRGRLQELPDGRSYLSHTHCWGHKLLETPFDYPLENYSPDYCSYNYVQEIKETKKDFNL